MDTLGRNSYPFSPGLGWGCEGHCGEVPAAQWKGSGINTCWLRCGFQWGKRGQARTPDSTSPPPPNKDIWRKKRCHISVTSHMLIFLLENDEAKGSGFMQTTNGLVVHLWQTCHTPGLPGSKTFRPPLSLDFVPYLHCFFHAKSQF